MEIEYEYINNERNRLYKKYYKTRNLKIESNYKNNSKYKEYYENGKLAVHYKN